MYLKLLKRIWVKCCFERGGKEEEDYSWLQADPFNSPHLPVRKAAQLSQLIHLIVISILAIFACPSNCL